MDREDFRKHAHALVDWVVDYYTGLSEKPVSPQLEPGAIKEQLPPQPPQQGADFEAIFKDFEAQILPGMTHWQHPGFMGYFPANASFPSLLGEFLSSALGAQCMSWLTSPAATELEEQMMIWLRQALGLPQHWSGVIQDTASTATFCALLSARERAAEINARGFEGQRFRVYASSEAHSSIEKAVRMSGIGSDNLVSISVDDAYALQAEALQSAISRDRAAGFQPLCVVAAWGTTGSTALDPIAEIGEICQREDLWLHVDAAYAGSALILPAYQKQIGDLSAVDSFVFNPHKWLFTHFDCSAYFVRDPQALTQTFALTPEYLKTDLDRQVNNYRDWGVQLGRRFRALKLWFVLRSYGLTQLREMLQAQIDWIQELAAEIDAHAQFERLAPTPLNLLCFRFAPPQLSEAQREQINPQILRQINASGRFFITHTRLQGRYTLRLVAGQRNTERAHVRAIWAELQSIGAELLDAVL